jgi:hypothetical protein
VVVVSTQLISVKIINQFLCVRMELALLLIVTQLKNVRIFAKELIMKSVSNREIKQTFKELGDAGKDYITYTARVQAKLVMAIKDLEKRIKKLETQQKGI